MHTTQEAAKAHAAAHYSSMAVETLRTEVDFVRDVVWDEGMTAEQARNALRAYFTRLPVPEVSDSDFGAFAEAERAAL